MQGNFLRGLVKGSSPFLIFFGMLSFIILGVFATDYYADLNARRFGYFGGLVIAVCISLIIEGGRFAFLLASVRDFSIGQKKNGWLGLIASLLLVIHDLTVSWKIAHLWSEKNQLDYFNLLLFLVLFGLAVEIRLVIAFSSKSSTLASGGEAAPVPVGVSSSRAVGASAPVS